MKRNCLSRVVALTTMLLGFSLLTKAQSTTINYTTGASVNYTVPAGVTALAIDARGASGGGGGTSGIPSRGGYGGRVTCNLAVTPGQVLRIIVGGGGGNGNNICCTAQPGGANGGGSTTYGYAGGGGGATDIRIGGAGLANRVVVAGGGGGAGYNGGSTDGFRGGDGGGLTGEKGYYGGSNAGSQPGGGGTDAAGGTAGSYSCTVFAGSLGTGGSTSSSCYSGAGGGGYYGGGAGSYCGGGGGSSFTSPTLTSNATHTQGFNTNANGSITICPLANVGQIVPGPVCTGQSTVFTITGTATGGVWSSNLFPIASVNASTGAVTGVATGTAVITYAATNSCGTNFVTTSVAVNATPPFISGNINVCPGSTTTLSNTVAGGAWFSSDVTMATTSSTGLTGIIYGVSSGTPNISYRSALGCVRTTPLSVNALPTSFATTGGGSYCFNGAGVAVGAAGSVSGTDYQLFNSMGAVGASVPGTGAPVDFGSQTVAGTYTVVATNTFSGCKTAMAGNPLVVINPLPTQMNLTGGGDYCSGGAGVAVGLDNSESSVTYQLYLSGLTVGGVVPGTTGSAISFGAMTTAGTYTVVATNTTTGCTNAMLGGATVNITPNPTVFTVTGGGNYCAGGTGRDITLTGSEVGVDYQVYYGGSVASGTSVSGTGSALNLGPRTTAGSYTVIATNATTGCSSVMSGSAMVTIDALPTAFNVTGGGGYCPGGVGMPVGLSYSNTGVDYTLYLNGTSTGIVTSGSGLPLDFGNQVGLGTYTVRAINGTTGCASNMASSAVVSLLSLPTLHTVTGGGAYCAGGTGVDIYLSGTTVGTSYSLMLGSTVILGSIPGDGSGVTFLSATSAGTYTVKATTGGGCTQDMTGSATVTINPLPVDQGVTGGGSYCVGGTGVAVMAPSSETGVSYQLYVGGVMDGSPMAGTGSALNFGNKTAAGSYTIVARNTTTSCAQNMTGSVSVSLNPSPAAFAVLGGGGYCSGDAGANVMISFSNTGVNYQLYEGTTPVGGPVPGTGALLDFGLQATAGVYTVEATNAITGCVNSMTGSATVSINSLPTVMTVTGGGDFCAGGTGVGVALAGTSPLINYSLYNGATLVRTMTGTGAAINFGLQTAPGTYTVMARNPTTSCVSNMSGSAVVVVNPVPMIQTVSGGGNYCTGGTGVPVGIAMSDIGIDYQLYMGTTPLGTTSGTGAPLNLATVTTAGSYTVKAMDATSGCASNMSGTAVVVAQPLPTAFTVTGGGAYCESGAGLNVLLSGSNTGINYQLWRDTTATGIILPGTSASLNFGSQTAAGTYVVRATNASTGCQSNMVGGATISINPLPTIYAVTGGGNYCSGSTTGVPVGLASSDLGIRYQLLYGGLPVGSLIPGTGAALSFGLRTPGGSYTVSAVNTLTGCTNNMSGSATVVIDPIVVPVVTVATATTVCSGISNTFTATPVNGGTTPVYEWYVNGTAIAGSDNPVYSYVPSNGDIVKVKLTSNATCATPSTAERIVTMFVLPNGTPSVTATADPGTTVCASTPVLFTAVPAFGGTGATYTWKKGSTIVGTGITYTYLPATGDAISCEMVSNYACRSADNASSNVLTMTVTVPPVPTVAITANPGTTIYINQTDTLDAVVTNGGSTPTYQWLINGTAIAGATSSRFIRNDFANNDSVTVIVLSSSACGGVYANKSTTLRVIDNTGVGQVAGNGSDIRVFPNPSNGTFVVKGKIAANNNEEVSVELTNMMGQVVYRTTTTVQDAAINLPITVNNNIASGMYLLNVRSESTNTVVHMVIGQ